MSNRPNTATARTRSEQAKRTKRQAQGAAATDGCRLSSTWIDPIQVTERELEVIELYLGEALDRLLGLAHRPQARGPP